MTVSITEQGCPLPEDDIVGASLVVARRLQWAETDAAGHNHFSSAARWLEEAEHELWRQLGRVDLVPMMPRVHVTLDFLARLYFDDRLTIRLGVSVVGRTSCTFRTAVRRESGELAVIATHVVVHAPHPHGAAQPWPNELRELLMASP